jgi:hypothetical protein
MRGVCQTFFSTRNIVFRCTEVLAIILERSAITSKLAMLEWSRAAIMLNLSAITLNMSEITLTWSAITLSLLSIERTLATME